ncbi:hypothetical protein ACE193_21550 [Bernardetia sp. OM2101]|uniref:hypothetical protein n=1 Tax=Bernardetia sp. OM2101 TaxID=3344876 RepID=UPI0035CEDE62
MSKTFFKIIGYSLLVLNVVVMEMLANTMLSCFQEQNYILGILFLILNIALFLGCAWVLIKIRSKI